MPDFIPQPDAEFDEWQKNYVKKLNSPWPPPEPGAPAPAPASPEPELLYAFLGIPAERNTELLEMQELWTKDYARGGKHADRRPSDVRAKDSTRKKYEALLRSITAENIRSNRKASDEIKRTLKLTVPDTEPSPHPQIKDPIVGLAHKGGGDIEVRCRTTGDQTRPSKPLPHILVQAQYLLVGANDPAPPFEQCTQHYENSHALSIMHLGISNVGKRFYGYFRWFDPIHPEDSGPWSEVHTVVVA